jgi:hypothetical protein
MKDQTSLMSKLRVVLIGYPIFSNLKITSTIPGYVPNFIQTNV